jgi:hypothetical protein
MVLIAFIDENKVHIISELQSIFIKFEGTMRV